MVNKNCDGRLMTWLLGTICSASLVRNPYLIAKLVEVIFVIMPVIQPRCKDMFNMFMMNPISENHLVSALMKFYTDVETTGSSSEFYDKFSIRYHISVIMKGNIVHLFDSHVHY